MCCRGAAAALLPQVNLLLAGLCSCLTLVLGVLMWSAPAWSAPPAVVAPPVLLAATVATLVSTHVALAAAHAHRHARRRMLLVYAVCVLLVVAAEAGVAAWAAAWAARWLRREGALTELSLQPAPRRWLRPVLPLLAPHLLQELPEEEQEMSVPMVLSWTAAALVPALQLLAALLALAARPALRRPSDLRTNSVVYAVPEKLYDVPSTPCKAPLDHIAAWQ
ncbi:uncharacterized protein LOC126371172 [Pectinophora gossypiella]|uniref:uncharacterized protein LOC126371172 n=1 Tax=Pectinophora gossypiella TaxID=13191 RepID=UPI00214E5F05|nr:uncharacterized protein LOC126371172 [Pectinophora gossypiella]